MSIEMPPRFRVVGEEIMQEQTVGYAHFHHRQQCREKIADSASPNN
ncbi:MAG: hypothetical protein R2856_01915 [Caldilineaceae bacterium]